MTNVDLFTDRLVAGSLLPWLTLLAGLQACGIVLVGRLISTWHDLVARDAMMVARPGVGLPVAVVGAIVAAAAIFVDGGR